MHAQLLGTSRNLHSSYRKCFPEAETNPGRRVLGWTCRRMPFSGLLPLQLRTSGPCPKEESMEEQDEKPPGPREACVQVSELLPTPTWRPRACSHPGPTTQPSGLRSLSLAACSVRRLWAPPDLQDSNTHHAFNEAPCISSRFSP